MHRRPSAQHSYCIVRTGTVLCTALCVLELRTGTSTLRAVHTATPLLGTALVLALVLHSAHWHSTVDVLCTVDGDQCAVDGQCPGDGLHTLMLTDMAAAVGRSATRQPARSTTLPEQPGNPPPATTTRSDDRSQLQDGLRLAEVD